MLNDQSHRQPVVVVSCLPGTPCTLEHPG